MRTLGLIGGMSWESTAVYYRLINEAVRDRLGGLHSGKLVLWSVDFAGIAAAQAAGDWDAAAAPLAAAARGLECAGADALVICTNTMHKVADRVTAASSLPLIHIADATAQAARTAGVRRPLLLATCFTMEQDFYVGHLREGHGLDVRVPEAEDRALVHAVIYEELCRGVVSPASRARYQEVVARGAAAGADGVILGCTEIGLLLSPGDVPLPVIDTTQVHALAAVDFALGDAPATQAPVMDDITQRRWTGEAPAVTLPAVAP
jgi:aspartate racemase